MILPAKYASKVGLYDVIVHRTTVKVRVVDNSDVLSLGLSELRSDMGKNTVAAIMVEGGHKLQMMVLSVKSRCLIIQVCQMKSIPKCLVKFVNDNEICFVGPAMNKTLSRLTSYEKENWKGTSYIDKRYFPNPTVMDVGDFAAKIIQDPTLLSKNRTTTKLVNEHMQSIADMVCVTLEKDTIGCDDKPFIDLFALTFTQEEIKRLVADVYASYLIAAKLIDSL